MEEDEGARLTLDKLGAAFQAFADAVNEELTGVEIRAKDHPLDLDPSAYRVLALVVSREGCSVANLAHATKMPTTALRRALVDLSAKGVARRVDDRIVATERGRLLLASTRRAVTARERRTKEGLHSIRDGVERIGSAFAGLETWGRGTADGPTSESV